MKLTKRISAWVAAALILSLVPMASAAATAVELGLGESVVVAGTSPVSADPAKVKAEAVPTGQLGASGAFDGSLIDLRDALWTFAKGEGEDVYTVHALVDGVTVNVHPQDGANQHPLSTKGTVRVEPSGRVSGSFYIVGQGNNCLYFHTSGGKALKWDKGSFEDRATVNSDNYCFFLYEPVEGAGEEGFPGFRKAASVTDGGQYLIVCAVKASGVSYILRPVIHNADNGDYAMTAKVTGQQGVKLTALASTGDTPVTVTAGEESYTVSVAVPSDDCTLHACPYENTIGDGDVIYVPMGEVNAGDFLLTLAKHHGASWKIIAADAGADTAGLPTSTVLEAGMKLVVTAEDGEHQSVYTLQPQTKLERSARVPHTQTDSALDNYFTFAQGKWSEGNANHTWSNALSDTPADTWYTVNFVGHKIDVYAGKNRPMGIVEYFIDDVSVGTCDLYNNGNIDSTLIATFGGFPEGEHVFKAVATGEKNTAATGNIIDCAQVYVYTWLRSDAPLYAGIVSDQLQYVSTDFNEAIQADGVTRATLNAWKNDIAVSQILLGAGQDLTDLTVTPGDFTDGEGHTIPAANFTATFVKSVQAYAGGYPGYGNPARAVPQGSRQEAAEVLWSSAPMCLAAGKAQSVWVEVNVPKDAQAGVYTGTLTVSATEAEDVLFTYTLKVADVTLPDAAEFANTFDIELWQNPYASAYYYGVEPFSDAHLAILRPIMEKYKSIGGHAVTASIVEEAWAGQTYRGEEAVKFPSMVKWSKNASNEWVFDYTDFDKWVEFNIELGLGDKIACYSVAPWCGKITYTASDGSTAEIASGSADWTPAWTAMLQSLMAHTVEKGWKERIYIGIDERNISAAAFDLVESVTGGEDNTCFKTATAMDGFTAEAKRALLPRITDWSVGSPAVKNHQADFQAALALRNAAGLKTTVYTCTEHYPSSFSLSAPGESYWTVLYAYAVGGQGFLRWAYDSWVADPLRDTTHNAFEPGDCFLIFPDEKDAAAPQVYSSLRLEKLAEGVRDANKLLYIKEHAPVMASAIDTALSGLKNAGAGKYEKLSGSGQNGYLSPAGKAAVAADNDALKTKIAQFTDEYLERVAVGDTKILPVHYTIPQVELPERYQSNVAGAASGEEGNYVGHERHYLGQPDMIQTPDGTLVTSFPIGHGKGALIMKASYDRGETWEELDIPEGWAESYETPTLYRLNFVDGSVRYIQITGRPEWYGNTTHGWDVSISDDAIHWTEPVTYQPDCGIFTTVAMASLVQLKDSDGNFIDKWMGVFHHSVTFVNYKTYLTFDSDGNMQWSEPEPYLSAYRSIESAKQICEVGMFRSPDGSRIVALGRTQKHNCPSVIFWSDDEGETWTKPVDLPGSLQGERHKALYDPISGRLLITFREITLDVNNTGNLGDFMAGDWIAWVGTYEDLMERREGQYRILLDEDWANNRYSGDTGYTGMAVYPDGTFVLDSYGHWDKEYSQALTPYNVYNDLCWIRQAKFKLSDLDILAENQRAHIGAQAEEEILVSVLREYADSNSNQPASGADGPAEWAFNGDNTNWWHSKYSDGSGVASVSNPVWIQTGFGAEKLVTKVVYQSRPTGNHNIIKDYKLQAANLADPTATPEDADFHDVKTGTLENVQTEQEIALDEPVAATHLRLVATSSYHGNGYVTAAQFQVFAKEPSKTLLTAAAPESFTFTPGEPFEVTLHRGSEQYGLRVAAAAFYDGEGALLDVKTALVREGDSKAVFTYDGSAAHGRLFVFRVGSVTPVTDPVDLF